ncbi:hypothetical protein [Spirosoma sp. KNUC1025]|uniref:hypothetical protein n=1 Tax=Spirosoma sp. KNUC1025 TaxID=2894082 RepID=UPI001E5E64CB|nr:hypothetical protein [Spirosoma sp. KNUC1025]UFH57531.1 hypothetical protein LN737_30985 [Spirosoma sp. KNUC1025]
MKHALVLITLAALVGLSSCDKNAVIDSVQPTPATGVEVLTASAKADDMPPLTTPHRLIKHGNRTLTYDEKNRLTQVTDGSSVTTFEYKPGHCYSTTTRGGLVASRVDYELTPTGRCSYLTYSRFLGFHPKTKQPNYFTTKYSLVSYAETGRLGHMANDTYDSFEKYEFKYDANNNLSQIKYYDHSGKLTRTTTLTYDKPYAGAPQIDFYELNPDINAEYMDPYLNVFGEFSKYLVRSKKVVVNNMLTTNEYYKYKLNIDGYVTARDRYDGATHAYQDSTPFEFVAIPPILSPIGK